MKNDSSSWLTIIVTAVAGVMLVVWHSHINLLQWLIVGMGVVLVIPGVYSAVTSCFSSKARRSGVRISGAVAAVGAVALGMWMIIQPTFFVGLIAYLFAALLIVYGILQLIIVGVWSRPFVLPGWFYVIPVVVIVAGVIIICTSVRTMNNVAVLITGIALIASAVNWALTYTVTHPAQRSDN